LFDRFSQEAIKAIILAQEESRRLGHNFVGTEQILLGLIGATGGSASKALKAKGFNLIETRREVETIIGRGSGFVAVEIPFTPRARRVLTESLLEAKELGAENVDTEHLLLALVSDDEGVGARVLQNHGVVFSTLRESILKDAKSSPQPDYEE